MDTETNNIKYETIGELRNAYREGELCGKVIIDELPTSKNRKGLAQYYSDSLQSHYSTLTRTDDSFQEGFDNTCKDKKESLSLLKNIQFTLKAIPFCYHLNKISSNTTKKSLR